MNAETKTCPLCETVAPAEARRCPHCTYLFALAGMGGSEEAEPPRYGGGRPDGGAPMLVGWICLAISLLLMMVAGTIQEGFVLAAMASSGFFSLFLVFWGVGYIVRAISYLPGRDA